MEKQLKYETYKFTDWSKHVFLTPEQRKQLIAEKFERAKIQYKATEQLRRKVGV